MRSLVITGLFLAMVRPVSAAPADDAAKAESLFEEGQKLRSAGKLADACARFEEALHYNRNAVGTILNVALCDQQAGKVASAQRLFEEARDRATEQHFEPDRQAAEDHLKELEGRVPHLAIAFAEAPTADTKLVIDDKIVDLATASDVPTDPGTATIVVTARGRVPYETKVEITEKEHKAVAIPKLGYPVTVKKGRRTAGKLLVYGGTALAVTGLGLGIYANHLWNAQFDPGGDCTGKDQPVPTCGSVGYAKTGNARTYGWVGTYVGGAGVLAAGIGAYLLLFGPHDTERLAVVPTVTADEAGLAAIGRF